MQLLFKRDEDNLSIEIKDGVATKEFDYVEMIKKLIDSNELEETIFEGEITEEERAKINEMVQRINDAVSMENEDENDTGFDDLF